MEIGHDRGGECRHETRGGRGDRVDGGENDEAEEGGWKSANIEGYINACAMTGTMCEGSNFDLDQIWHYNHSSVHGLSHGLRDPQARPPHVQTLPASTGPASREVPRSAGEKVKLGCLSSPIYGMSSTWIQWLITL